MGRPEMITHGLLLRRRILGALLWSVIAASVGAVFPHFFTWFGGVLLRVEHGPDPGPLGLAWGILGSMVMIVGSFPLHWLAGAVRLGQNIVWVMPLNMAGWGLILGFAFSGSGRKAKQGRT